jgi:uncharacterized membrane protein (UPF0127 family)
LACTGYLLLYLACCTPGFAFKTTDVAIETADGRRAAVLAEAARSDAERERGLMYRKELADGKGMIFIFEREQMLSFWMKNTLIPLSIAFIAADGRIVEIHDMEPGNLNSVRSSRSCRFALEVPQGWFARTGVGVGDKVFIADNR